MSEKFYNKCHFRPWVLQEIPSLSSLFSSSAWWQPAPNHQPSWRTQIYQLHPASDSNMRLFFKNQKWYESCSFTCIIALIIISASSFASAWKKINKVQSLVILPSGKVGQATVGFIYDVFVFVECSYCPWSSISVNFSWNINKLKTLRDSTC